MEDTLRFDLSHKAIIDRFGRYPHHNAILGRTSTAEELTFLSELAVSHQHRKPGYWRTRLS